MHIRQASITDLCSLAQQLRELVSSERYFLVQGIEIGIKYILYRTTAITQKILFLKLHNRFFSVVGEVDGDRILLCIAG